MSKLFVFSAIIFVLFCCLTVSVIAADTTTTEENISVEYSDQYVSAQSLYDSLVTEQAELEELNLSTVRYGDLLLIAKGELDRIASLEEAYYLADSDEQATLSQPEFDVLFDRLEEISTLKQLALQTRDEFIVLEDFLIENNYLEDNATYNAYVQANESFRAERYEEAMVHIESAREKASEYDALNTKVKALVAASSRNIKSFLQRNWEFVLGGLVLVLALFFILKKIIRRKIIQHKLKQLQLRKESVHELTKQIQKEYFSTGKLSESAYHIRLKVYGEMVRDIRRQIPLLEEELALQKNVFGKKKSKKSKKSKKQKPSKHEEHKTSDLKDSKHEVDEKSQHLNTSSAHKEEHQKNIEEKKETKRAENKEIKKVNDKKSKKALKKEKNLSKKSKKNKIKSKLK